VGQLELAAAEQEAVARVAFEADQRIRSTVRQMRRLWIELARELHAFVRAEMWRDLDFDTLESYLADPGIELERRYAFNLVAAWEQLVVQREVPEERLGDLRVSKVLEVLPAIRSGAVSVDRGLADAEVLPRRDLEIQYRGLVSGGQPDVDSTIRTEREPRRICAHCGHDQWRWA
jgi:hypothetical protein